MPEYVSYCLYNSNKHYPSDNKIALVFLPPTSMRVDTIPSYVGYGQEKGAGKQ